MNKHTETTAIQYLCSLTVRETYMSRCIELALKGAGLVAPNPMVGAILVNKGKIIGEGYHQYYGKSHAEVNCINDAIAKGYGPILTNSELYVSLEPCAHHGKTPPCAELIIQYKIPKVIIGCRDPFPEVDGKGIEKLKTAGVEVVTGILENECKELNKRFFTFHQQHRPWILLKWAQTADGFIAGNSKERLLISNESTNRLVHKWRSEEAAILVGTNTTLKDNPQLNNRYWPGPSPLRLVVDLDLKLPEDSRVFDRSAGTLVFNSKFHSGKMEHGVSYYQVSRNESLVHQIIQALYQLKILSLMVEGGANLLQQFIDEGYWDEIRKISNRQVAIGIGLKAPQFQKDSLVIQQPMGSDMIETFANTNT